jgi:type II secretory pathway pseudopilin PulG
MLIASRRLAARGLAGGFTLIEVTVVVLVVTLLLGSLLYPLSAQLQQRRISSTQRDLDEAREALIGFAMANGRLPCPDTDGDGLENARGLGDAATDGCAGGVYVGALPWATLGTARADAWGNQLRYRVTNEFTRASGDPSAGIPPCTASPGDPNSCTLQISDIGTLAVSGRNPSKALVSLASQVPAVVISFGANGYGAVNQDGIAQPAPPAADTDEQANAAAGTTTFMYRTASASNDTCSDTAAGQPYCEFDDQVVWVPVGILISRMVAAGKLP